MAQTRILKSKTIEGLKIFYREGTSDEAAIKEVLEKKSYRKRYFKIIPGERWLDLGGNCGTFACYAAQLGATVESYEPDPDSAKLILLNASENNLIIKVHEKAVTAGSDQPMTFFRDPIKPWRNNLFRPRQGGTERLVNCVKFKDILTPQTVGVKMDIEGAELGILSTHTDWQNVKKLCFEWHFDLQPFCKYYRDAICNLKKYFDELHGHTIPDKLEVYNFFPPAKVVFCVRSNAT